MNILQWLLAKELLSVTDWRLGENKTYLIHFFLPVGQIETGLNEKVLQTTNVFSCNVFDQTLHLTYTVRKVTKATSEPNRNRNSN